MTIVLSLISSKVMPYASTKSVAVYSEKSQRKATGSNSMGSPLESSNSSSHSTSARAAANDQLAYSSFSNSVTAWLLVSVLIIVIIPLVYVHPLTSGGVDTLYSGYNINCNNYLHSFFYMRLCGINGCVYIRNRGGQNGSKKN